MSVLLDYMRLARLDHWIKQFFVLPGILLALVLVGPSGQSIGQLVLNGLIGLLATSCVASANYVLNEWLDARFDQYHPLKKTRPVVARNLKTNVIVLEYLAFSFAGLTLGAIVSTQVLILLLCLWVMGVLYNVNPIRLKEIAFFDVLSESLNNVLRLLIGWYLVAANIFPPVSIVFGYWMGGAFLMATKRFAEYRMIGDPEQAAKYRSSFARYNEKSLLITSFFYALLAVFFCGIFMIKYRIELLLAIPFLCGLFCLYLYICYKPDSSAQRPEKLFKEKALMLYLLFFIALCTLLLFIDLPALDILLDPIVGRQ